MNKSLTLLSFILSFLQLNTAKEILAKDVQFSGRNQQFKDSIQFDNPGVSFSITVKNAINVYVLLSQKKNSSFAATNFFLVTIDGVLQTNDGDLQSTFSTADWVDGELKKVKVASGLNPTKIYSIQVFKNTEAQFNQIIVAPNYMTLHAIDVGNGEMINTDIARARRKIEFIGDSITAGFCNLCEKFPESSGAATESHYLSWPASISRTLGAEFHTIAWSGYGLLNNCCGGDTTVPQVYKRTLLSDSTSSWTSSNWIPQVVVINLGTNDGNSGKFEEATFSDAYLELALNITKAYGNEVTVFLACGPMSTVYCGAVWKTLDALEALPAEVKPKAQYFLDQTALGLSMNCCGHPSAADHAVMATSGAAFIGEKMGWN